MNVQSSPQLDEKARAFPGPESPASDRHVLDAGIAATPLPYVEFTHALRRANRDFWAVTQANRTLADAMRAMLRRQQDLAFELAETARKNFAPGSEASGVVFDDAAAAVRELGQSMIDAQLAALSILAAEAQSRPPEDGRGMAR